MTQKECFLKPCSKVCQKQIEHGAKTDGVGGCPVSRGGEGSGEVCISKHPGVSKIKKDSATNNAISAKLRRKVPA